MNRIKLTLSYDGICFCGFQRQNGLPTVQGELESALERLYGENICVSASGRTDAGVHALGQVAHYDCCKKIDLPRISGALNYFLPDTIRVIKAEKADENFDARKSAHSKTYFYDMYFGSTANPVLNSRAYFAGEQPNVSKMKKAAALFEGIHDFKNFRCEGSSAKTTVRNIYLCQVEKTELYGSLAVRIKVSADGFLYKMVRIICGAILRVGKGEELLENISAALNNPDSDEIIKKIPLPPEGLYLQKVEY